MPNSHWWMNALRLTALRWSVRTSLCAWVILFGYPLIAAPGPVSPTSTAVILVIEGKVDVARASQIGQWKPAVLSQGLGVGDRIRTFENSRALLRLADATLVRVGERSTIDIRLPKNPNSKLGMVLERGIAYLLNRNPPDTVEVATPTATCAIRGTEFVIESNEAGATIVSVLDGHVLIANAQGETEVTSGQEGKAVVGEPPTRRGLIEAEKKIQWVLYFPAVLDVTELKLTEVEQKRLASVLQAYREGSPAKALEVYPELGATTSPSEQLLRAAVYLASGSVARSRSLIEAQTIDDLRLRGMSTGLRRMIESLVSSESRRTVSAASNACNTATEWVAESFVYQSRGDLRSALNAARQAVQISPGFSYGWVRVGELEFGFGHVKEALRAIERALESMPRSGYARAMRGFINLANKSRSSAVADFQAAIELEPALGLGWLGRGLTEMSARRRGPGRKDMTVAAALEPNRSFFRSYLGKAYLEEGEQVRGLMELTLAKQLDANDPTPWLYSALAYQRSYQFNQAVADLEESSRLNDNRRIYRSSLLLDQDRAVRGANVAVSYEAAGALDAGIGAAALAVQDDPFNAAAHRFFANSYNALRDPSRFNLRHETVWFNENLIADVLEPLGATSLSQHLSQYEYSSLFQRNAFGVSGSTLARSDGQYLQSMTQTGSFDQTSYALDVEYQHNDGTRPNHDLRRLEHYAKVKQQLGPADSILLVSKYQDFESGDNFQHEDVATVNPDYRYKETQLPWLISVYRHEWTETAQTLVLLGHVDMEQQFIDPGMNILLVSREGSGALTKGAAARFDLDYQNRYTLETVELNHLQRWNETYLNVGGRFHYGALDTRDTLIVDPNSPAFGLFPMPNIGEAKEADYRRAAGYAYLTQSLLQGLQVTGGVTYDSQAYPGNHRLAPLDMMEQHLDRLQPKVALSWAASPRVSVRAAYSQFAGGLSLDESVRLEPSQLVGFSQAYRNVISESVAGSVSAPGYETVGLAIDTKPWMGGYAGMRVESLTSTVDSPIGGFTLGNVPKPLSIARRFEYDEQGLRTYLGQLWGPWFGLGVTYSVRDVALLTRYPEALPGLAASLEGMDKVTLHQPGTYVTFSHTSGIFARADATWYLQHQSHERSPEGSETFPELNLSVGYRFLRSRGMVSAGILNLLDHDYHLNPLSYYYEMPHERVFFGRLSLQF